MIYLLYGPDDFSIRETVRRLVGAALPAETADLNLSRLNAGEVTLEGLRFACESVPFLADRRAVVVEGVLTRFATRRGRRGAGAAGASEAPDEPETGGEPKGGRAPALASELAGYLPQVPEQTLLIFVESDAPPKTGPLARALTEARARQQFFPVLAGRPLTRWIRDRATTHRATIAEPAAELLASFVGGDLHTLSHEVAKLATYAGPGRTIDVPDVKLLVSHANEASIFDLVDALGQGNRRLAVQSLHVLLDHGERPERILGMVARQVRLLLQAREGLDHGEPSDAIGRTLGLAPFPLRKVLDQARLFNLPALEAMHRRVLEADLAIKTGEQAPALALELLVAELAGVAARRRPATDGRRSMGARR